MNLFNLILLNLMGNEQSTKLNADTINKLQNLRKSIVRRIMTTSELVKAIKDEHTKLSLFYTLQTINGQYSSDDSNIVYRFTRNGIEQSIAEIRKCIYIVRSATKMEHRDDIEKRLRKIYKDIQEIYNISITCFYCDISIGV